MKLDKVIIWGHQLHDHTHSYIHNGFTIAFRHMGYKTYWLADNQDNLDSDIDFNNSLFISHGLKSKYLPINNTSIYILHNFTLKSLPTNSNERYPDGYHKTLEKGIPVKNIVALHANANL